MIEMFKYVSSSKFTYSCENLEMYKSAQVQSFGWDAALTLFHCLLPIMVINPKKQVLLTKNEFEYKKNKIIQDFKASLRALMLVV